MYVTRRQTDKTRFCGKFARKPFGIGLTLQHDVIDGLARAARSGPLSRERLADAAAQVGRLQKFARAASSIEPALAAQACGTAEHRAFIASLESGAQIAGLQKDPTEWRA